MSLVLSWLAPIGVAGWGAVGARSHAGRINSILYLLYIVCCHPNIEVIDVSNWKPLPLMQVYWEGCKKVTLSPRDDGDDLSVIEGSQVN